jgi:hypothetical protein
VNVFHRRGVALLAVEFSTEGGRASRYGCHPRSIHPRRVVTYVLLMATLELRDPVALLILVVTRDSSVHERILIARHMVCVRPVRSAAATGAPPASERVQLSASAALLFGVDPAVKLYISIAAIDAL